MKNISQCIDYLDEKLEYAEEIGADIECELLEACILHLEELKKLKDAP